MKPEPNPVPWESVYVFISSTFNDMHAERDYLVKQVFPELREWCEQRRLHLIDVDLRWGVTEQDATQNRNAVRVCLERIDECRPFFLCFLGQRRGWIPQEGDISRETLNCFPRLRNHIGQASITEMEILHAFLQPLHGGEDPCPEGRVHQFLKAEHSFFYLRDDSYLADLPAEPAAPLQLRATYTNEGVADPVERASHDGELARWRADVSSLTGRGRKYSACWDPRASTPELRLPIACPSTDPRNIKRWRDQWRTAGVHVGEGETLVSQEWLPQANNFNHRLSSGRLSDFKCDGEDLKDAILADLRQAISSRYPEHVDAPFEGELQKEIDQQEQFLRLSSEGFIEREGAFHDLDGYLEDETGKLFILTAPSGMGKSMLLSRVVSRWRGSFSGTGGGMHFRFVGQSDGSNTIPGLLRSLLLELQAAGRIPASRPEKSVGPDGSETPRDIPLDVPMAPQQVRDFWLEHLPGIGFAGPVCLVIDAVDQLERGLEDFDWLPTSGLPENVKIIVSLREDADGASKALRQLESASEHVRVTRLRPFDSREDRIRLVNAYLSRYLKEMDAALMDEVISMPGAGSPLFLKVLLSELRVFGAFANLGAKIGADFGDTPMSAFNGVLNRLESDPAYSGIPPDTAVPLMFGLLAHARTGLSAEELSGTLTLALGQTGSEHDRSAVLETVHLFLRQVRPFLASREGRVDFFYQSFREAAKERYTAPGPAGLDQPGQRRTSRQWHRLLAGYFTGLPLWSDENRRKPDRRKVMELPYHLTVGEMWDEVENLLTDIGFLEAKVTAGMAYDLRSDFHAALAVLPRDRRGCRLLKLLDEAIGRDIQFIASHAEDYPQALFQCLWNSCWWYDCPEAIKHYENTNLARRNQPSPTSSETSETLLPSWAVPGLNLHGVLEAWRTQIRKKTNSFRWIRSLRPPRQPLGGSAQSGKRLPKSRSASHPKSRSQFGVAQKAVIGGHGAEVSRAVFSPDSKWIASAAWSNPGFPSDIRLWDAKTGKKGHKMIGHDSHIWSIAFSPNGDEIVSGSHDKSIRFWNVGTGKEMTERQILANAWVYSVAYSPDGKTIAYGSSSSACVWDIEAGKMLFHLGQITDVRCVCFSPDGKIVAVGAVFDSLSLWDTITGDRIDDGFEDIFEIQSVCFSPCGRKIATAHGAQVSIWDVSTGRNLGTLAAKEDGNSIRSIAFSPNGKIIAGAQGKDLYFWDIENPDPLTVHRGHQKLVFSVSFSPDGNELVSGSEDRTVKQWILDQHDPQDQFQEFSAIKGHEDTVTCTVFSPDGTTCASGSYDKTVRLWDSQTGLQLDVRHGMDCAVQDLEYSSDGKRLLIDAVDHIEWEIGQKNHVAPLQGHSSIVKSVVISPDGNMLVSGSSDNSARIWKMSIDMEPMILEHEADVECVAISPDGKRVISGSSDGSIHLWDSCSGEPLGVMKQAGSIKSVTFSKDGTRIASGAEDCKVCLWDFRALKEILFLRGSDSFTSVKFSPDGRKIAGSCGNDVFLWDASTGDELAVLHQDSEVFGIDFSPTSQHIMIVGGGTSYSAMLCLWDTKAGSKTSDLESGHQGRVNSVAFSPDGKRIASGSFDKTIRIWDIATQKEIAELKGHHSVVECVTFSPDGKTIASGSWDRSIRLWNADVPQYLAYDTGARRKKTRVKREPIIAVPGDFETRISYSRTRAPVAFFSVPLKGLASHPSELTWAGGCYSDFILIHLEGEED